MGKRHRSSAKNQNKAVEVGDLCKNIILLFTNLGFLFDTINEKKSQKDLFEE